MIVYKATNKINGKVYIGYTSKTLPERIYAHLKKSKNTNEKTFKQAFKLAIRKYGENNFIWEELALCKTKEEACQKEIEFIKLYNSITPNGYNMTYGGEGGIPNNDVKKKISISLLKFNKENPKYFINKYMEKTTFQERSEKGKKAYQTRLKNGNGRKTGYKQTQEAKIKMSESKSILFAQTWYNFLTKELVIASATQMEKLTGIPVSTFSHLKNRRQAINKKGWIFVGDSTETYVDLKIIFERYTNRFKFGIK